MTRSGRWCASMSIPNSRPDNIPKILIYGGRSWVGFHIQRQFSSAGSEVICTTSSDPSRLPLAYEKTRFVRSSGVSSSVELLEAESPDIVINLLIGTTEQDYAVHAAIAKQARENRIYYIYASSALALDGYPANTKLEEHLCASAISEYGKFKQRCEEVLLKMGELQSLILRFSSIHGWSPYKETRTVALLGKVAAGEFIEVSRGVVQNRCTDVHLAETVHNLAMGKVTGVAHIGAGDCSEEVDFLRLLAETFGYSSESIIAAGERNVNLAVVPKKGLHPKGAIDEAHTLRQLCAMPELKKYSASSGSYRNK